MPRSRSLFETGLTGREIKNKKIEMSYVDAILPARRPAIVFEWRLPVALVRITQTLRIRSPLIYYELCRGPAWRIRIPIWITAVWSAVGVPGTHKRI